MEDLEENKNITLDALILKNRKLEQTNLKLNETIETMKKFYNLNYCPLCGKSLNNLNSNEN